MTKTQSIFKHRILTALVLLMLVLFILWLFSPLIISQIIKNNLPKDWQLSQLEVGYPFLNEQPDVSGIEFRNIEIITNQSKININQLFFPFFGSKQIIVNEIRLDLLQADKQNAIQNKTSLLPVIEPVDIEYDLKISKLEINNKQFKLLGAVEATPKAIQFWGHFKHHKQSLALELNLFGFDGLKPLEFSAKLEDQFLIVNYPWQNQISPQSVSITGSVQDSLWALIQNTNLLPAAIEVSKPQIAFNLKVQWPSWPKNKVDILDVKFSGEAQFEFNKLSYGEWQVDQNSFLISSKGINENQLSTTKDIILNTNFTDQKIVLKHSKLTKNLISFENSEIKIKDFGTTTLAWKGKHVSLITENISVDMTTSKINLSQRIKINWSGDDFVDGVVFDGGFELSGLLKSELSRSQAQFNLSHIKAKLPQKISQQNWRLNDAAVDFEPMQMRVDLDDFNMDAIVNGIALKGKLKGYVLPADGAEYEEQIGLFNRCNFNLKSQVVNLKCSSSPTKQYAESIVTDLFFNIKNKLIKAKISTAEIDLTKWPIIFEADKDLIIESGKASLDLRMESKFSQLLESDFEQGLKLMLPGSFFEVLAMDLKYQKIVLKSVGLKFQVLDNGNNRIVMQSESLELASGLKFIQIKSKFIHQAESEKNIATQKLILQFGLFDGKAEISSDDFGLLSDSYHLQANLSKINLQKVLDWIEIDGLKGTGMINGELPLRVNAEGFSVTQGAVASTEPGIIRYMASGNNSGDNIALDALKNFHYSELSLKVKQLNFKYQQQGNFVVPIRVVGRNPQSQFDNRFAINPVIQGLIPAETWSHLITGEIFNKP